MHFILKMTILKLSVKYLEFVCVCVCVCVILLFQQKSNSEYLTLKMDIFFQYMEIQN